MSEDYNLEAALDRTIEQVEYAGGAERFAGKVRDSFTFSDGSMAIVVTDRVSAFDFNLGTIPYKGQVLNGLAAWWFGKLDGIGVPHHLLSVPHPNISLVKRVTPLPIELVVRAYLTGTTTTSSWHAYQHNSRMICGIEMPAGMKKNEPFAAPICTPTTKPDVGHDMNISMDEIVEQGLVAEDVLAQAETTSFQMFALGQQVAAERGLILVDTKYEMGLTDSGDLIVIDEVHTPDSSRYWVADSYSSRMASGQEPESLDKEFVRRMIVDSGYRVDSDDDPAKFLTDAIRLEAAERYLHLYQQVTGEPIAPTPTDPDELGRVLASLEAGSNAD